MIAHDQEPNLEHHPLRLHLQLRPFGTEEALSPTRTFAHLLPFWAFSP
jgi:hypothetical protein